MQQPYPLDPNAHVERSHSGRLFDPIDIQMGEALRAWSLRDDPREPMGAIVFVQFADGFALRYVGAEVIDEHELMRRVAWIADTIREVQR